MCVEEDMRQLRPFKWPFENIKFRLNHWQGNGLSQELVSGLTLRSVCLPRFRLAILYGGKGTKVNSYVPTQMN